MKLYQPRRKSQESTVGGDNISRRDLLTLASSLTALSLLPACRRPAESIVPRVSRPEQVIPGKPLHYATALSLMGTAFGLLVETHDGRPTKVEGNPCHPETMGASSSFLQASIMQLYDPDRSRSATQRGSVLDWQSVSSQLSAFGQSLKLDHGRSFAVLTDDHRSPTLAAALKELQATLPDAQFYSYATFDRSQLHAGAHIAFGRRLETVHAFSKADVVVVLDADPLSSEGSPLRAAREWAARRAPEHEPMNRWYVIESSLTITGSVADHRFRCEASDLPRVLCALVSQLHARQLIRADAALLGAATQVSAGLDLNLWGPRLNAMANDLSRSRGRSLIVAGLRQPKAVHALAHWLNDALENQGVTLKYVRCFDEQIGGAGALAELANRLRAGNTQQLLILGANPVYDAPSELDFSQAMTRARTSIHAGLYHDETAQACTWHVNQAHPFESWGDVVSEDGTGSVVQPLIAPLFDGHSELEVVRSLLGKIASGYDCVRDHWMSHFSKTQFEHDWRKALHDGIIEGTGLAVEVAVPAADFIATELISLIQPRREGYEITLTSDAHAFDGRYANNAWLHELPEPFTKVTWGNVARVSQNLAAKYELSDGDVVSLGHEGRRVQVPVLVAPGQADNTISITLGQGRESGGRIASSTGVNAHPLRSAHSPFLAQCSYFERQPRRVELARSQEQFSMQGRAPVQVVGLGETTQSNGPHSSQPEFVAYPTQRKATHAFAMSIDLSKCTGCNACAIACQAENNVSIVGADGVRQRRLMHWLRMDRHYEGTGDDLVAHAQPIVCQQCENAPCETVCPAGATVHSPDGLNDMVYNRCVGSRYCANNCPFKVRKFNYVEYWSAVEPLRRMQLNPDVTVRSRGVMEKCTFCVQRINAAKIDSKRNAVPMADGAIATACEQACPTKAIIFGDLVDRKSRVTQSVGGTRSYRLVEELNLQARVHYLSKVHNPNPELKS